MYDTAGQGGTFNAGRHASRTHPSPFAFWASPTTVALLLFATAATLVIANRFPALDLETSRLFVDPACTGKPDPWCPPFPLSYSRTANAARNGLHLVPVAVMAALLLSLVMDGINRRFWLHESVRLKTVLLTTLAAGPVLLINGILKDLAGRPRPNAIDVFGGEHPFAAVGDLSAAIEGGRSFVSGEAAIAAWIVCAAFALPQTYRRFGLSVAVPTASLWLWLRVAVGSHFLSDVIVGAMSTFAIFSLFALATEVLARRSGLRPEDRH